jgi:hypothetical protein
LRENEEQHHLPNMLSALSPDDLNDLAGLYLQSGESAGAPRCGIQPNLGGSHERFGKFIMPEDDGYL